MEDLARLKDEGLSLREIAERLGTSYSKVRHEWSKRQKGTDAWQFEDADGLFENYERDRMAALPRDPWTIYTYWELTSSRKRMTERHFGKGWEELPKALRVYDVNAIEFHGDEANRVWEIDVGSETDHWFIQGLQPDCCYIVDFGIKTSGGPFVSLLRSDSVKLPPDRAYDLEEAAWSGSPDPAGQLAQLKNGRIEGGSGLQKAPEWMERFTGYSLHP